MTPTIVYEKGMEKLEIFPLEPTEAVLHDAFDDPNITRQWHALRTIRSYGSKA